MGSGGGGGARMGDPNDTGSFTAKGDASKNELPRYLQVGKHVTAANLLQRGAQKDAMDTEAACRAAGAQHA